MIKTVEQAIGLVYSSYNRANRARQKKAIKNQELSRKLLDAIGRPDAGKQIILVTGSKGKGSTATFTAGLLSALSFNVGLFTSPHQFHFTERIQRNGHPISDAEFIRLANDIYPIVNEISRSINENEYLGPIAISLAIAFLYFKEKNVDYIVLETGKGGLLDDTNVVENNWAMITPIMEEHVEELGPRINHIIDHKLGIIKGNHPSVIIGKQQERNQDYISKHLAQKPGFHYCFGKDFFLENLTFVPEGTIFDATTKQMFYKQLFAPLIGSFQCENIVSAIQACENIIGQPIQQQVIEGWLKTVSNPGKCEMLTNSPVTIADATINKASALYLKELINHYNPCSVTTVIGLSEDKDFEGVLGIVKEFSHQVLITEPQKSYKNFRAEKIYKYAKELLPAKLMISPDSAFEEVLCGKSELVFILGNHSFVSEARHWFRENILTETV